VKVLLLLPSVELLKIDSFLFKEGFKLFIGLSHEISLMVLTEDVVLAGTVGTLIVSLSSVPTEEKSANLEVVTEVNRLFGRAETDSLLGGS
jgi:hypothetical protein